MYIYLYRTSIQFTNGCYKLQQPEFFRFIIIFFGKLVVVIPALHWIVDCITSLLLYNIVGQFLCIWRMLCRIMNIICVCFNNNNTSYVAGDREYAILLLLAIFVHDDFTIVFMMNYFLYTLKRAYIRLHWIPKTISVKIKKKHKKCLMRAGNFT